MKNSMQLSLNQNLTLTPQLQQAIKLLQLSSMDLATLIQDALDENPLLEIENADNSHEITSQILKESNDRAPTNEETIEWEHIYTQKTSKQSYQENGMNFDNIHKTVDDLKTHLNWQINLTPFSKKDNIIASHIIDSLDDNGFLISTIQDLHGALHINYSELEVEVDEIKAVLHLIQRLEPVGVAATNLSECLSIQLEQFPSSTPLLATAKTIVKNYLSLLAKRDYSKLCNLTNITAPDLDTAISLIKSLSPKPGAHLSSKRVLHITPDVITSEKNGIWRVYLNDDIIPNLRLNAHYASLINTKTASEDSEYVKTHLQDAKWMLKSLQNRNDSLLRVSTYIVNYQMKFFTEGEKAMKPLTLNAIATELKLHESTISRVTANKYISAPNGVFELKYFFSSYVGTNYGVKLSSVYIQDMILKLVSMEPSNDPLSDIKLHDILTNQGVKLARRTVSKYRENAGILPACDRKTIKA